MSKTRLFFLLMISGMILSLPALSYAVDLTTWVKNRQDQEQNRIAKYTTGLTNAATDTCRFLESGGYVLYASQGIRDYVSYKGNSSAYWWRMNNGGIEFNSDGTEKPWDPYWTANTFDKWEYISTYFGTTEDFFGYQFLNPASISELKYSTYVYGDGGVFNETPRVEVLTGGTVKNGGTWSTIDVSWDIPYDTRTKDEVVGEEDPASPYRDYVITPTTATDLVWGVRIIGDGRPVNPYDSDNRFVNCSELQVSGTTPITESIDLSVNLALNQNPIWTTDQDLNYTTQFDRPETLLDGDLTYGHYDTTFEKTGFVPANDEEYAGVIFNDLQEDVTAIGITMYMFKDGGYLKPNTIRVEYTTDTGSTWTSVTGLDLGRYAADYDELSTMTYSCSSTYICSDLFRFDTIETAIDGIRIIGEAEDSYVLYDTDGFLAVGEFEVFAAAGSSPVPGDANNDGQVDGSDVTILANNWQYGVNSTDEATWAMGDFNGDGQVDGSDVTILANNWQYGITTSAANVPEPSTAVLLLGLAVGFIYFRRRR